MTLRYHLVTVPLSEHEQKILDEIEKNLATEDPRFAEERLRVRRSRGNGPRVRWGALTFLGGFALLILFFVTRVLIVGLLAFGGMVAGIVLLASALSAVVKDSVPQGGRGGKRFARSMSEWEENVRKRFRRP